MLFALGAASSALNALQSITGKKAPSTEAITGKTKTTKAEFDLTSATGATADSAGTKPGSFSSLQSGVLSPDLMNALISAQSQAADASKTQAPTSKSAALKDLFAQLDSDGNGQISKAEFEDKLGAGGTNTANADSVFGKLDKDGDGSISAKELAAALKLDGRDRHGHRVDKSDGSDATGGSGSGADPLQQALQGASTTTTTNSDGTTTTTLTYADGSKVSTTSTPVSSTSSSGATSSYNFVEQMIKRQAEAISAQAKSSVSVSA